MGGCFRRLKAFAPEMRELIGPRFAWMDLDMAVVGDLTPLFDRPEPAVFWAGSAMRRTRVNGSMVLMTAGSMAHVWQLFEGRPTIQAARETGARGTDQCIMSYLLPPRIATWDALDGVLHYDLHCTRRLPANARVVFFPGINKPTQPNVRKRAPWVRGHWPMGDDDLDPTLARRRRTTMADLLRKRRRVA